ncbi:MAG: hypothetical protein AAF798_02020 [Bacteroidota bacterium]
MAKILFSTYLCEVKYFAIILAIVFLVSELCPCKSLAGADDACHTEMNALTCHDSHADGLEHSCHAHASDTDEDHSSEEGPCSDGCSCYCCTIVVVQSITLPTASVRDQLLQPSIWQIAAYAHEFTHSIWQPPPHLA